MTVGLLLLWNGVAAAEISVPPLASRVTDLTGTLNSQQRGALEDKLEQLERSKGSQIAVLMLPSTEPETIEQYGIRVGETWKLGRKGVDDGAILIVAKQDRAMRIEVGYGLEGALNDAICKRIISETITPFFKRGDFYEGIDAGIDQMIAVINGEPLPEPNLLARPMDGWSGLMMFMFVAVFFVGPILRLIFGRAIGSLLAGGLAGLVIYLISGAWFLALFAGIIGLVIGLSFTPRELFWGAGGFNLGGGFRTGGGGGWGGGGGGFGGGGASGHW